MRWERNRKAKEFALLCEVQREMKEAS